MNQIQIKELELTLNWSTSRGSNSKGGLRKINFEWASVSNLRKESYKYDDNRRELPFLPFRICPLLITVQHSNVFKHVVTSVFFDRYAVKLGLVKRNFRHKIESIFHSKIPWKFHTSNSPKSEKVMKWWFERFFPLKINV